MSILVPTSAGSALRRATNITTTAMSVFLRIRMSGAPSAEAWAFYVGTAAGSDLNGHSVYSNETSVTEGRSIHGIIMNSGSLNVYGVADWSANGTQIGTATAGAWFNLAMILYEDTGLPKIKVAFRAHPSGSLVTQILDPHYSFTNALVRFGAGHGAGNPLSGLMADAIIYSDDYTDDGDITDQFDAQGPVLASIYGSYAFRGEASVSAAANDETNSNNLTVEGAGLATDTTDPSFGPTLSGSGQLPSTNSAVAAPNSPTSPTLVSYTSNAITVSFGTNSNDAGTRYVIEYQPSGGDWVGGGDTDSSPITANGLIPGTTYSTRIRAEGAGGASSWVTGPVQATKRLLARCYINSSAVGVTGVTAQLWRPPVAGGLADEEVSKIAGAAFESSAEENPLTGVSSARIDLAVTQTAQPLIAPGDTLRVVLTAGAEPSDKWSKMFNATVVEID
jgi:hypothetical protein